MHPLGKRREDGSIMTQWNRKVKQSKHFGHGDGQQNGHNTDNGHHKNTDDANDSQINRVLPRELILKIFSFLDLVSLCRCATVCKYWNLLAHDGSIWQDVDLFEFQRDVQGPVIENIARRCGLFLKRLNLRGCQHISDEALKTFAFYCKNIEVLVLQECKKVTDETCRALSKHCPKLHRLNIDSCELITDDGLRVIADGCRHLEDLNMSWCDRVTEEGIRYLAEHCLYLKNFVAKGCAFIHDEGVRALAEHCLELKVLNLNNCPEVSDNGIHFIGKQCPELEYISLSNCSRITDESLIALSHGCPKIKYLELSGCTQLSDNGFNSLCKACPDLHCLDLEECLHITDATLVNISTFCHKMERLCLSHCELVSDEGIQHLAHSQAARSGCLKSLELDNCPLITDTSLDALQDCPSLQRIDLYDCQQITRGGIRRLKTALRTANIHAYFAPLTPPPPNGGPRQRICRCCNIL